MEGPEGSRVPSQAPEVIDSHVHFFPARVFEALWRWFDANAWPVRYRLHAEQVAEFLLSRGVERLVALHYAHKPGMARGLNHFIAELCQKNPKIIGLATVYPGEPGAEDILRSAFAQGLRGLKLHCHVQSFSVDDAQLHSIYATCVEFDLPLVMHAGREPRLQGYPRDPYELCDAAKVESVLKSFPKLKLCVPHLGMDELERYEHLLERYDNLWLDTTMAVAGYFNAPDPERILRLRPERILYGTDFPNLPYSWDRELRRLLAMGFREQHLAEILAGNARTLFEC